MRSFFKQFVSARPQDPFPIAARPALTELEAIETTVIERINSLRKDNGAEPLAVEERFARWVKTEGRNRAVTGRYAERDETYEVSLARYRLRRARLLRCWQEMAFTGSSDRVIEGLIAYWVRRKKEILNAPSGCIGASARLTRTGEVFLMVAVKR